eukprot:TRINITY_DN216_c0_g1_i1.p1 TRINITY_DN216_c0_g1~~TRINITY_DN216_c0_g1_i1.p1  ORF type:complete len:228 (+),score=71.72 TRINITY_DN216_c0_g1_i1:99-782(+)
MQRSDNAAATKACCCNPCTCGTDCTCGSHGDDMAQYKGGMPKEVRTDLVNLEEKERQERMTTGVDPMTLGNIAKVNQEVLSHGTPTGVVATGAATLNQAKEKAQDLAHNINTEAIKSNAAAAYSTTVNVASSAYNTTVNAASSVLNKVDTEAVKEKAANWGAAAAEAIHNAVDFTKEKLGMESKNLSIDAMEEKERARRMSDSGVDPLIEAKQHRVQEELLENVKKV